MKYIMMDVPFGTEMRRAPIMFPDFLTHSVVAEAIKAHPLMPGAVVVSAGEFASMDLMDVEFSGQSVSLGLKSLPGDDLILPMLDYTHGILT